MTKMFPSIVLFVKRYFYVLLGILAIIIVHIGFSRTYLTPVLSGTFAKRKILHVHGAIFMLWLVISTIQPFLVQKKQFQWHKRIGVLGFVLAGVMTLFGLYIGISATHIKISHGAEQAAREFLFMPITDMILFATFAALALRSVKNPEAHKRYIVLTALSILPAATVRTFSLFTWWTDNEVIDTFLALLIMEITLYLALIFDWVVQKRIHPVYVWGGLSLIVVHAFRDFVAKSEAWMDVANWIIKNT